MVRKWLVRKDKGAHLVSHLSGIYNLEGESGDTHTHADTHTPLHVESQLQIAATYHRCTQTRPQKRPDLTCDRPPGHTHTHSDLHVGSAKSSPSNTSHAHMLTYTHTHTHRQPQTPTEDSTHPDTHRLTHSHSLFHVQR